MGYFGHSVFENDKASDWIESISERNVVKKMRSAILGYLDWTEGETKRFTKEQIDRMVVTAIENDLETAKYAPDYWKDSGLSIEDAIRKEANEYREYLESGRYLDEEYGPVEEALAAAELVRQWSASIEKSGKPDLEHVELLVNSLRKKPIPDNLLAVAIRAVEKVLASERYHRMRSFYLKAFPNMSGGDDRMSTVQDLLEGLKTNSRS